MHAPPSNLPLRAIDSFESPVGPLLAGASSDAICRLEFCDQGDLQTRIASLHERNASLIVGGDPLLDRLRRQLEDYFAARRSTFDVPLAYAGTAFQQLVWATLLRIPYGETWSYLDVAQRIGDPAATRAVGAANHMNPIAIVIPCHRVVNANGKLGGYGGGLRRKQILLDLELGQGSLSL
ncbi:MAG: methylated-DNA--[protein]-cysteine S-methyltransferase [Steroidobacter sp.]